MGLQIALKSFYQAAIVVGVGMLGWSAKLYMAFDRVADAEQAPTPGQKSLGVTALGAIHLPTIFVTGACGLAILSVGMLAWALYRRKFAN